jgi:hypothetical protein
MCADKRVIDGRRKVRRRVKMVVEGRQGRGRSKRDSTYPPITSSACLGRIVEIQNRYGYLWKVKSRRAKLSLE